jgi:hypothetical protein
MMRRLNELKKDVEQCGNCPIDIEFRQSPGETKGNHGKLYSR